jgi:putative Mg2+ transporter-C (MgtC) family protein
MEIWDIVLRIGVSAAIGAVVGLQREFQRNSAGFRTHMLVAIGASIAMLTNELLLRKFGDVSNMDVSRMASYVISGIGFLGAGSIIKDRIGIRGLTTAAGLWVTACLGITAGAGFYWAALIGSAFVFIIIAGFKMLERKLFKPKREVKLVVQSTESELPQILKILGDIGSIVDEVDVVPAEDGQNMTTIKFAVIKGRQTDVMVEVSEKLSDYRINLIKVL